MPPIKAWDELLGMPYHQVTTFQTMAPHSAPKTTWYRPRRVHKALPTVAATEIEDEDGDEVEEGGEQHGLLRLLSTPVDHNGSDGVRRVVETVTMKSEQQRQAHQDRDDPEGDFG